MKFSGTHAIGLTLAALLASACGKSAQQEAASADSTRNLQMAPATPTTAMPNDNPAPTPTASAPRPVTPKAAVSHALATGTGFQAEAGDTISSRHTMVPYAFNTTVATDVMDATGAVVIPAGSVLRLRLTEFASAPNKSAKDGKIAAIILTLTINGKAYTPTGTVDSIAHLLKGRGVTAGTVAKVGGGAAAGAVIGGLIGKTKGAVIGGVVGAGAGTAVAVESGDRDVVIMPGSRVYVTLTAPFAAK